MIVKASSTLPCRVVHITWGLNVGGLEKLLVEMARHGNRDKTQLHFISLGERGILADDIEAQGWSVEAMGEPEGLRPGMILRLAKRLRRAQASVVHTHDTKALVYGGPAARLAGVRRLIHTWHGQQMVGSPREAKLFRWVGKLPHHVVAVSHRSAELMREMGIKSSKIRTVINGIDTNRFAYSGPVDDGAIVTVARLSPEKDIATLLQAAAVVCRHQPKAQFKIAGDGACRNELHELTKKLKLQQHVELMGQVNDVPALLSNAKLFVLSSLAEGIPLTLLEAMGRGLPIVATNVGGIPEVVIDGETGFLVPPHSPEKLAEKILHLLDDTSRQRKMGEAGRRRVVEVFDIGRMIRDYEQLYGV